MFSSNLYAFSSIDEEQRKNNWPGLAQETELICQELGIESVHATRLDGKKYRQVITEALHKTNERRLKLQAQGKVKCEIMFIESYGKRKYLAEKTIKTSRQQYKARFKMTEFAGNFSKDRRFSKSDWLCKCFEAREEESHILSGECRVYGEIRQSFGNLDNEDNLVMFFSRVLEERARLEEEEEESPSGGGDTAGAASGGSQPPQASMEASQPSLL